MKVGMIFGNPVGEFYGGISTHVEYLTKYLSHSIDLNLILITFGDNNSTYSKDGINHIELKKMKLGKFFYPIEIFYDLFRLERVIKKINPDIIHLQGTSPNFSLFGLYILKKYPVLITLHGYFNEEYKIQIGWRKIFYRFFCAPIERITLSKIPHMIVLCPQMKKIISTITTSEIYTIPNGIDLEYIRTIKSNEKKDYPTIFFLGYLTKGKGVQDLFKAISLVKNKIPDIQLYIGGSGPYMTTLKKIVQGLNLKAKVNFLGLLNEKEKFAYMKSMDIFVLPSYWESFPIVLLESLACGKPIITTNVGGNPFAVTDGVNGLLVQPGNPDELAEKLVYLFQNRKLLDKMGEESKKRATEFDWEIIALKTIEIYRKISN